MSHRLNESTELKKNTIPVELDTITKILIEEPDKVVMDYVNVCVQHFTDELKKNVNGMGYEVDLKVNVIFRGKVKEKKND
jgi:hypothetical protein